jgi:hypothetical protein
MNLITFSMDMLCVWDLNWYTVKLGYNEQLGTGHFFRYNRVNLCSKMTNLL